MAICNMPYIVQLDTPGTGYYEKMMLKYRMPGH